MKPTHILSIKHFIDKFQRWVKLSETRKCYYFIYGEVVYFTFSVPEENFMTKVPITFHKTNAVEWQELLSFSERTEGILEIQYLQDNLMLLQNILSKLEDNASTKISPD